MFQRAWTIGAVATVVVPIAILLAVRPELADNANLWVILSTAIPSFLAVLKAEESSKKAQEGHDATTQLSNDLKNGTITNVVKEAIVAVADDTDIKIEKKAGEVSSDPR